MINWQSVALAIEHGATTDEVAALSDVDADTLRARYCEEHGEPFETFFHRTRAKGRVRLRLETMKLARKGNALALKMVADSLLAQESTDDALYCDSFSVDDDLLISLMSKPKKGG